MADHATTYPSSKRQLASCMRPVKQHRAGTFIHRFSALPDLLLCSLLPRGGPTHSKLIACFLGDFLPVPVRPVNVVRMPFLGIVSPEKATEIRMDTRARFIELCASAHLRSQSPSLGAQGAPSQGVAFRELTSRLADSRRRGSTRKNGFFSLAISL